MSRRRARVGTNATAGDVPTPTVGLWYHPQLGARVRPSRPTGSWPGVAGEPGSWTEVARLEVAQRSTWDFTILPGQRLPRGYVWADPSRQVHGMGGPHLVYASVTRRCRDCGEVFTWSARAQQHLYETLRQNIEVTALRCQPCARTRRALESARARYAAALAAVEAAPTAAGHVRVATLMLEILERGGQVSIARAIGHCTRARRLGATTAVAAVEATLRARARG